MGTIIQARRETDQSYQYCKIYEASANPGIGGWGVRGRDAVDHPGNILCVRYPLTRGTTIESVCFYVSSVGANPRAINIGVWGQSPTVFPTRIYRIGTATITEDEIGATWASRVGLVTTVSIDPILVELPGAPLDMVYYLSFTGDDVNLESGTTTIGSSLEYTGGVYADINDPAELIVYLDEADFTDNEEAVSVEAWGRVGTWLRVEQGGTIEEVNTEWQTEGTYYGDWTNVDNAFVDDAAVATAEGTLYIDLGGGITPATTWNEVVAGGTTAAVYEFPDYDEFGVRALSRFIIRGTVNDAHNTIDIMYCAVDTSSIPGPAAGWENLAQITGAGAFDEEYPIPQIARWIKIVQAGAVADDVSYIEINQIGYGIDDGRFTVDHTQIQHRFWVDNYPITDEVYKLQVANMAGAESEASSEFTNRINKD